MTTHDPRHPRHPQESTGPSGPGYETTDVTRSLPVWMGLGLALLTVAAIFAMRALFASLRARSGLDDASSAATPAARGDGVGAEATRLPEPGVQLEELRRTETLTLSTYGWVDRETGRVRIPIERAMELLVERAGKEQR